MSVIVSSDSIFVGGYSSRALDYNQDGTLWVALPESGTGNLHFRYSKDDGATWNTSSGSTITDKDTSAGFGAQSVAFFIDIDDYAHVVYFGQTGGNVVTYRRGTPNVDRTAWTWSDPYVLDTYGAYSQMEVIAFRNGTGWRVFVAYDTITTNSRSTLEHFDVTSGGAIGGNNSVEILHTYSGGTGSFNSLDFHHTQSDPKAVDGDPHVYVTYTEGPGGSSGSLYYRRVAYSGGTWTVGTERTLDVSGHINGPNLIYDGTRILISHQRSGTNTVVRVDERDEADTTTTNRDPTALSDGQVLNIGLGYDPASQNLILLARGATSADWKKIIRSGVTWGSWIVVDAGTSAGGTTSTVMRGNGSAGPLGAAYRYLEAAPDETRWATLVESHQLSASLQGVGTLSGSLGSDRALSASLQGVGDLSGLLNIDAVLSAQLQGVGRMSGLLAGTPALDFTVYDLYIDDGTTVTGYITHEDDQTKGTDNANPIRAEKQDVGQNPSEQRPEFGDHFAQGDFSHGADQSYFHHVGRDERKFLASEGFDISEPGHLHHLHDVLEALDGTSIGSITQANDVVLVAEGNDVRVGNGLFPGTWANEDPHNAEGDTAVLDLTSRGDEVFAALGANGVHIRSSAGVWDHFQPDGATDLSGVGNVTKVEWLKDRLIIAGDGGRGAYEVVADSTPTVMKTLPEGWTFEKFFEAGAFVYGCAVNADAGQSRVHIFGLNSGASALEDKGSVPIPRGELIYTGIGDPGGIFLGGGRRNDSAGGYDPIFYQALQSENGFLQLLKIAQGKGVGANDCSVLAFETLGDAIVMSWSLGTEGLTGARTGIAWYHLGRQAFAHHLKKDAVTTARVKDILFYEGRILFAIEGDGLYYEDLDNYVAQAYLITSVADWGSAGQKIWDQIEVSHHHLPSGGSVRVDYTTSHPEEDEWMQSLVSSTAGSLGHDGRLSGVESRLFALKLISNATGDASDAPHISSYSVRSNPTRSRPEYALTRFLRILAKDRKDKKGPVVYKDPVATKIALQQLLDSWVTVYEPGITWTAFVRSVSTTEPVEPFLSGTTGEPLKEAYLIRLDMVATGEAA